MYPSATLDLSELQRTAPQTDSTPVVPAIAVAWLYGMFLLLPVKIIHLPSNLELVDIWVAVALPFFWIAFVLGGRARTTMSYGPPILVILIATCLSALHAPSPMRGAIVLVKELYLFVWFVTLTVLLSSLHAKVLRRMMAVWAAVVTLHGLLILAQFLVPDIWHLTIGLAGQSRDYENFRASGLFISEKAGDANKAAFFQLAGFVPLALSSFPRRMTTLMAALLFLSILATGSMGTTGALMVGVGISVVTLLFVDKTLRFFRKYVTFLMIVVSFLAGSLAIALDQSPRYRDHLTSIVAGRAEKSSGGRFALWQRGIDAFHEHDVLLWGVGPENFREVDSAGNDNQLHNDALAFMVERGLLGVLGLFLLAVVAIVRAVQLVGIYSRYPDAGGLAVVVFIAAMGAILTVSLTHQIFHAREMWIVLAVQEAMVVQARASPDFAPELRAEVQGAVTYNRMGR